VGRIHHRTICVIRANKIFQRGTNSSPKQTLRLVQPSFANVNLIKANLWGYINRKMYGFLYMP
jgi:hypothetical protein